MCGRFVLLSDMEEVERIFEIDRKGFECTKGYNIAPGREIAALVNAGERRLVPVRWGFIPFRFGESYAGRPLINARAETVAVKPAFRTAFKRRRCLVIANGYFEWQKRSSVKIPYFVRLKTGKPFGFAALYELDLSRGGTAIPTCAIITTHANRLTAPIHTRMPAIIAETDRNNWLDPGTGEKMLLDYLRPYDSNEMEVFQVSNFVNSPRNDSPVCVKPVDRQSAGGGKFPENGKSF